LNLDTINLTILIIAAINTVYGLVTYSRNRSDKTNFSFFILTLAVSFWGLTMFAFRASHDPDVALFYSRLLYVAASTIPFSFLFFAYIFPESEFRPKIWQTIILPIPFILSIVISLSDYGLINHVIIRHGEEAVIVFNQIFHSYYGVYIILYFSLGYIVLFEKYLATGNLVLRTQIKYIMIGTLVSTIIGVFSNLILPYIGIFDLNWLGQVGVVVMISLISYSILKYQLFNIQVIATELFTFSLWIFILIRTLTAIEANEKIINGAMLILTVIIGMFLIRSVQKEVRQREKIQKLAEELSSANDRLKELDRMKSEFVSLATHQIRGPLTAIKGYASMILEGDFGELKQELRAVIDNIYQSSQSLVLIVEDFLNISRIEQGRMKYEMSNFDLGKLTHEVVEELRPNVEKAKLTINFETNMGKTFIVHGDIGKIKQVIGNLIDNAIKYTPHGSISVSVYQEINKIILKVTDSGIGIAPETLPKLFKKFQRAADANKTNVTGTGLGLYVAAEMIKAHNGKIWAESLGHGKGSTFYVELAAAK